MASQRKPCFRFSLGRCPFGNNCQDAHVKDSSNNLGAASLVSSNPFGSSRGGLSTQPAASAPTFTFGSLVPPSVPANTATVPQPASTAWGGLAFGSTAPSFSINSTTETSNAPKQPQAFPTNSALPFGTSSSPSLFAGFGLGQQNQVANAPLILGSTSTPFATGSLSFGSKQPFGSSSGLSLVNSPKDGTPTSQAAAPTFPVSTNLFGVDITNPAAQPGLVTQPSLVPQSSLASPASIIFGSQPVTPVQASTDQPIIAASGFLGAALGIETPNPAESKPWIDDGTPKKREQSQPVVKRLVEDPEFCRGAYESRVFALGKIPELPPALEKGSMMMCR